MNATLNWVAEFGAVAYEPRVETAAVEKALKEGARGAKHVAMVLAAPLIGLAFVVAFPVIGVATLAWMAVRALPARVKDIGLFVAAPFIGLAYLLAFPVVGLGALAWAGIKAAKAK